MTQCQIVLEMTVADSATLLMQRRKTLVVRCKTNLKLQKSKNTNTN